MDTQNAVNTTSPAAVEDTEAVIASLKEREAKLVEERDNWKTAALKYKGKASSELSSEEDEERMRAVARQALAESGLADLAKEQQAIIERTLKENKELKLAHLNKNAAPPAAMGTHQETIAVQDGTVSPEQMNYFKNILKWDDKTIERYKQNLRKKI